MSKKIKALFYLAHAYSRAIISSYKILRIINISHKFQKLRNYSPINANFIAKDPKNLILKEKNHLLMPKNANFIANNQST